MTANKILKRYFGVFHWKKENHYPPEHSLRTYQKESYAQKYADMQNHLRSVVSGLDEKADFVVRPIYLPIGETE